jgi:hypothetical protein
MRIAGAIVVATVFLFTGCTYNRDLVVSSADRGPNDKVVGLVRGHSEKSYLFGVIQTGDDSLGAAMEDAISRSSVPAQGIINVFAEKYCTYYLYPLFWECGTSLTGAAIQYAELGNTPLKIQKGPEKWPAGSPLGNCPQGQKYEYGSCYPRSPIIGGTKK